jgi:hypothetical protein
MGGTVPPMRRALAIALLACTACAEDAPPRTIAGQQELTQREWIRFAQRKMRSDNCSRGGLFRRCSDTTRDECEQTLDRAWKRCIADRHDELPARIGAGDQDWRLRQEMTGCTWHHAAFDLGPARIDMLCLMLRP